MGSRIALVAAALCLLRLCLAAPAMELKTRACIPPPVNPAALDLIRAGEGFEEYPYPDGNEGLFSVGYGHLCGAESDCYHLGYSIPLSREDAESLFLGDVHPAAETITMSTASSVVLNENQFGALVSWAFNVGSGNAATSSLMSRLNALEDPNLVIPEELRLWNKIGEVVSEGLINRREEEIALALTPTNIGALPVPC